ncbi:MAG: hypothetical protein AVDCRST_MAG85-1198, partial [uncultured Solirubrobacteraceae bacterium]
GSARHLRGTVRRARRPAPARRSGEGGRGGGLGRLLPVGPHPVLAARAAGARPVGRARRDRRGHRARADRPDGHPRQPPPAAQARPRDRDARPAQPGPADPRHRARQRQPWRVRGLRGRRRAARAREAPRRRPRPARRALGGVPARAGPAAADPGLGRGPLPQAQAARARPPLGRHLPHRPPRPRGGDRAARRAPAGPPVRVRHPARRRRGPAAMGRRRRDLGRREVRQGAHRGRGPRGDRRL